MSSPEPAARHPPDLGVELITAPQARALAAEIGEVYGRAFAPAPYHSGPEVTARFVTEAFPSHCERAGFRCAIARDDRGLRGFAYVYRGERGQFWTDWVRERVPPAVSQQWLGGHLELVELGVCPDSQGVGIGGALHDAVLAGAPQTHALLSARRDAPAAWGLYRRRGWRELADLDGRFSLLGRRLP